MSFLRSNEAVLRYYTEEQQAEVDQEEADAEALQRCAEGHHMYRYVGGGPDDPRYKCEDCGSTDPDSATEGVTV